MLPLCPQLPSRIVSSISFSVWLSLACLVSVALGAGTAGATIATGTATTFTGDPLSVSISIDDAIDPGNLVITLQVDPGNTGDLRGFFAHVSDESLLSGLSVSGSNVSSGTFDANNVINLGGGNNLNGGGSPCPCDLGLEIGSPGIGSDDLQTVTFTLSHATLALDLSVLLDQDFGVRATSVGPADGSRNGSSKLGGVVVPEPSTALLMGLGLCGLALRTRRHS